MRRLFLVGVVALAGCYVRRTIVVPPTEHGVFCQQDAHMHYEICVLQQRGWIPCAERRDNELLSCPGAYELDSSATLDAGLTDTGETPTYGLPGYKP